MRTCAQIISPAHSADLMPCKMKLSLSLLGGFLFSLTHLVSMGRPDEQTPHLSTITNPPSQVKSKRAFIDTPYGQIHYKFGGDFASTNKSQAVYYTFLLLHGNPRSCDEFTELVAELAKRFGGLQNGSQLFSYIAMDLLGEGHSDDPVTDPSGSYVSMTQYAEFMIEITAEVFAMSEDHISFDINRYIVPLGSLTGSAIATELSYQLTLPSGIKSLCKTGNNCKLLATILHDPMYYFSEQIVENVHLYADQQRKWQPKDDGSHLLEIWNDANYQPYKNLVLQDRKSLDRFRAATTQWQVILSYADYSSTFLLTRLIALSKRVFFNSTVSSNSHDCVNAVHPLVILYGGEFLSDPMMDKVFEMQKMRELIADATKDGLYEKVIDGGNQAMLSQNATIVADIVMEQIMGRYCEV